MAKNLNIWTQHFTEHPLPLLNKTVSTVLRLTRDDTSSTRELADFISQNASLTATILRVVNSSVYAHVNGRIHTIHRAILLIGYKRVANVCLAAAILDMLIQNKAYRQIVNLFLHSYHIAMQARSFARLNKLPNPEEVFLAGLFYHYGEIAFWSFSGCAGNDIAKAVDSCGTLPIERQQQILGTTFKDITLDLVREWKISTLLENALLEPESNNPEIQCIINANLVADACLENSPSRQLSYVLDILTKSLNTPRKKLFKNIETNYADSHYILLKNIQ